MKERIVITSFFILFAQSAWAQEAKATWQLGVFAGEESGLSLYRKQNEGQSIELQGKFGSFPEPALLFAAVFRAHFVSLFETQTARYPMTLGVSAKAGVGLDGRGFLGGLTLPLGIVRETKTASLFIEMSPGFVLLPEAVFDLDASVGLRFLW